MTAIPLLLIGTALDGPTEEVVRITSPEQALEIFGGYRYDRFTLSASTTAVTLVETPWNNSASVWYSDHGTLVPYPLFGMKLSGKTVTFAKQGVNNKEILIKYMRPQHPTSVIKGVGEAFTNPGATEVYVMRIGGVTAYTFIGTGSTKVTLYGEYAGGIYNTTSIVVTGSKLLITPPAGMGIAREYSLPIQAQELAAAINLDNLKGYVCLKAKVANAGTVVGIATSAVLSQGSSGTMTTTDINNTLSRIDLAGVSVASIIGMNYEDLTDVLTADLFDYMAIPTTFVQSMAPKADEVTSVDYALGLVSANPHNRLLALTTSQGFFNPYQGVNYWGGIAIPYAMELANSSITTSWKNIGIRDFTPSFSAASIQQLSSDGYIVLNRSVAKDVVVNKGTTSDGSWNTSCAIAYRAVCHRLYEALEQFLGDSGSSSSANLDAAIDAVLSDIPSIRDYEFSVIYSPNSISVDITIYVIGELREISFQVGVSSNAATPSSNSN